MTLRDVLEARALGQLAQPGTSPEEVARIEVVVNPYIDHLIGQLMHHETLPTLTTPSEFVGQLRAYQMQGFSWLAFLRQFGLRACLGDDMGLGKTVQFLAYLLWLWDAGTLSPSLLVCPTSVLGNWERECARFAPGLAIHLHDGGSRLHGEAFVEAARAADLVSTSYALTYLDEADLPEKSEQKVFVALTTEQAVRYESVLCDLFECLEYASPMARRGAILAALTRLKQICYHPAVFLKEGDLNKSPWWRSKKLDRLLEMVEELRTAGDQCLIFSQYVEAGKLIVSALQSEFGEASLFLHGGTPKAARDQMVETFSRGDGPGVMVQSLRAGGVGLNLTAGRTCFTLTGGGIRRWRIRPRTARIGSASTATCRCAN